MTRTPTNEVRRLAVAQAWDDAGTALERELGEFTAEERVFVKMRVLDGCTVNEIARAFHLNARSFRRRFEHLLSRFIAIATVPDLPVRSNRPP